MVVIQILSKITGKYSIPHTPEKNKRNPESTGDSGATLCGFFTIFQIGDEKSTKSSRIGGEFSRAICYDRRV